jgi:fatty acid synthase subunit alpha
VFIWTVGISQYSLPYKLVAKMGEEKVKEMLGQVLEESYAKAQAKQKAEGHIKLERGFATIPLPGIDVPFHSRYLWAGVMPFRACMYRSCSTLVHYC